MRTYKLLRNNKETGPYSFEQLLQLQLKPLDLVWVDGRSAAWRYPCELAELAPYVPEPTDTLEQMIHPVAQPKASQPVPSVQTNTSEKTISTPKKIHVTLPGNKSIHIAVPQTTYSETFQQKQEVYQPQETYRSQETYQPKEEFIQHPKQEFISQYQSNTQPQSHYQYQPQPESFHNSIPLEEEVNTKYSRSLNDVEDDYTNWMYQKKTQKKSFFSERKNMIATGVLLVLVAASVFALNKLTIGKPAAEAEAAIAKSSSERAVPTNKETSVTDNSDNSNEASENENKSVATAPQNERTENNHEAKKIWEKKHAQKKISAISNREASVQTSSKQENRNVEVTQKEVAVERNQQNQTQSQNGNATTEKRKKIRDVVKDFFARIKSKKQEAKNEDEPPVTQTTQEPKHAEGRTSTKRGDDVSNDNSSNETSTTNIADEIELSGSSPSNGWMMGVSGLKITLRNGSNVALKSAAVEVLYYDENNRLLEKKTIYFSNVPPRGRQTVAAPDQKWADHTEFRLGSVSAKEDRFAQN